MEKNEQIIAAMFVTMIRKVPKPNKKESYIAYLTNVYTLKEYRNQGVGIKNVILHKKLPETKQM